MSRAASASERWFGLAVRTARLASCVSDAEFAARADLTARQVTIIERCEGHVTLVAAIALANAIGSRLEDMVRAPLPQVPAPSHNP